MDARFSDRTDSGNSLEQPLPKPHRDQFGLTWLILRIAGGNPDIVVETDLAALTETLVEALDAQAIVDLAYKLSEYYDARSDAWNLVKGLDDDTLRSLAGDTLELHQSALAEYRERHPDQPHPLEPPAGPEEHDQARANG